MSTMLNALGLKKKKTPEQLVRLAAAALEDGNYEALQKRLGQMKAVLYGDEEKEPELEKCQELSAAMRQSGLMPKLVEGISGLPFEARKDVAQIFNNLVRKNLGGFVDYVEQNGPMIKSMIAAYGNPDIALLCGQMLRECTRYEGLARMILYDKLLWSFFDDYVHLPNFDVASDAFATLRDLLTRNKQVAKEFLEERFDVVFEKYTALLKSENYVTRRQSLKLLGELLLDRYNFRVMMRYISSKENLKLMMNLLRDKSQNIQFEAFHVFKVFVANPKKPPEISRILVNNRDKLIAYLENFHNDKDDEQFREEKLLLINTLSQLEMPPAEPPAGGSSGAGASSGGGGSESVFASTGAGSVAFQSSGGGSTALFNSSIAGEGAEGARMEAAVVRDGGSGSGGGAGGAAAGKGSTGAQDGGERIG